MPKRKHAEGGTAVLEPKAPGLSTREALRLVYAVEDAVSAVLRAKPKDKTIRKALRGIAAVREELEDRFDGEEADKAIAEMKARGEKPIPWEVVKRELGL